MLIWLVVVGLTRFVSVGSITAVVSIPVLMMVYRLEWPYLVVGGFFAAFAVYKHIPNIKRLIEKTEPRIGKKKV